jgi:hypothetical protein
MKEKTKIEDEIRKSLIDDNLTLEEEIPQEKKENEKDELIENNEENNELNGGLKINQKEIVDLFMTGLSTCHSAIIDEKEFISKKN